MTKGRWAQFGLVLVLLASWPGAGSVLRADSCNVSFTADSCSPSVESDVESHCTCGAPGGCTCASIWVHADCQNVQNWQCDDGGSGCSEDYCESSDDCCFGGCVSNYCEQPGG